MFPVILKMLCFIDQRKGFLSSLRPRNRGSLQVVPKAKTEIILGGFDSKQDVCEHRALDGLFGVNVTMLTLIQLESVLLCKQCILYRVKVTENF